jgi:hypothetical protein
MYTVWKYSLINVCIVMDICVYDKLRNIDKGMLLKHITSNWNLSLELFSKLI